MKTYPDTRHLTAIAMVLLMAMSSFIPLMGAGEEILNEFGTGNTIETFEFLAGDENDTLNITLPARAVVVNSRMEVTGSPYQENGTLRHQSLDFDDAPIKENMVVGPDGISIRTTTMDWQQAGSDELSPNLYLNLTFEADGARLVPNLTEPDPDNIVTGLWLMNDDQGSVVKDKTKAQNDGVFQAGDPQWVPGRFKSGIQFDGIDDEVRIPSGDYEGKSVMYDFWMKTSANTGKVMSRFYLADEAFSVKMTIAGRVESHFDLATGDSTVTGNNAVNDGEWHHIAVGFHENFHVQYIDGKMDNYQRLASSNEASGGGFNLSLGRGLGGGFWAGTLDALRISTPMRSELFNYSNAEGWMDSPEIPVQDETAGNIRVDITIPEGAGYSVDVMNTESQVLEGGLKNGDPIMAPLAGQSQIKLRIWMWSGPTRSMPELHSWGVGTTVAEYMNDPLRLESFSDLHQADGEIVMATDIKALMKSPDNPVLEAGYATAPSVIKVGGSYHMYHTNNMVTRQILLATSPDGIEWTNHVANPVLSVGTSGNWDDDWVDHPCVVRTETGYNMYYTGASAPYQAIGLATSTNGQSWTREANSPILSQGTAGQWDSQWVGNPWVIRDGDMYRMYYTGSNGGAQKIGMATSVDGYVWVKYEFNPIMVPGASGWSSQHLDRTTVVKENDDQYHMFYSANSGSTPFQIGYAQSNNGIQWTSYMQNPIVTTGSSGSWDDGFLNDPAALLEDNRLMLWYIGDNGLAGSRHIGLAVSRYGDLGRFQTKSFQMGPDPAYFTNISVDGVMSEVDGTNISIDIGTSNDDISWSAWSPVVAGQDLTDFTTGEYVRFRATLTSDEVNATPVLTAINLSFEIGTSDARLYSDEIGTPLPVRSVLLDYLAEPADEGITINVSADGGTTWTTVPKKIQTQVPTGNNLRYKIEMEMLADKKVTLDNLSVYYLMESWPTNVLVKVGNETGVEFFNVGDINGTVALNDRNMTKAINEYIRTHEADVGADGNITIPISVRSETAGVIKLSGLQISYLIRPKVIDWGPTGDEVELPFDAAWVRFNADITSPMIQYALSIYEVDGDRLDGTVSMDANGSVKIVTGPLKYGTAYRIRANTTIRTEDHIFEDEFEWNITTMSRPAGLGPSVVDHGPLGDKADKDTQIWLEFNRAMDISSVRDKITVKKVGGPQIGVTYNIQGAGANVTITPISPLEHNTTYSVRVDLQSVTDTNKISMEMPNQTSGDHFLDGDIWGWNFTTKEKPGTVLHWDLKVMGISCLPTKPKKDEMATIQVGVLLTGDPLSQAVHLRVVIDGIEHSRTDIILTANSPQQISFQHTPENSTIAVTATIDPSNLIVEIDEVNNELTQSITVEMPTPPPPPPNGGDEPWYTRMIEAKWPLALLLLAILAIIVALVLATRSRRSKQEEEDGTPAVEPEPETATDAKYGAPGAVAEAGRPELPIEPAVPLKPVVEDFDVDAVFYIYNDGRLIASEARQTAKVDQEIMSGMLTAVKDFVKDTFEADGGLDSFTFGSRKVLLAMGQYTYVTVAISGKEPPDLKDEIQHLTERLEANYTGIIESWDGDQDAFPDIGSHLTPLFSFRERFRIKDIVQVKSGLEFYRGYVRLKVGVSNKCTDTIHDVKLQIGYDQYALRLVKMEPERPVDGEEVDLGSIEKGKKKTMAYYLDPIICQESDIKGTVTYTNNAGERHSVDMKTRPVDVVCPLFYTKDTINVAMLKRLVEELRNKDSKWFSMVDPQWTKWVYEEACNEVGAHDVKLVRSYTEGEGELGQFIGESWYYGETSEVEEKLAIMVQVQECNSTLQVMVASDNLASQTGLLAELGKRFLEKMQGYIEPIFEQISEDAICRIQSLLDKYGADEE